MKKYRSSNFITGGSLKGKAGCRVLPTICLSVFDHFVGLALKGLINEISFAARGMLLNRQNVVVS